MRSHQFGEGRGGSLRPSLRYTALLVCILVATLPNYLISSRCGLDFQGLKAAAARARPVPEDSLHYKKVLAVYLPQVPASPLDPAAAGISELDFYGAALDDAELDTYNRYGHPFLWPAERRRGYTAAWEEHRRHQGEQARHYGIHGFVVPYWFDGHHTMRSSLDLMLEDGHPDLPYCLHFANPRWALYSALAARLPVLAAPLTAQAKNRTAWREHFDWLLPHFRSPRYIQVQGKPMLLVSQGKKPASLEAMAKQWQQWARAEGFVGLHIVQASGPATQKGASAQLQGGMDASVELFPEHFGTSGVGMNDLLSSHPGSTATHYYGASAGVDTSPLHIHSPRAAQVLPLHPASLSFWLRQNLARTPPGGFVLVDSWNDWAGGSAIEPSLQWGHRRLEAVRDAVQQEEQGQVADVLPDGFIASVPLQLAGVPAQNEGAADGVCIVVRTHAQHASGMYNLHQTLNSLLGLRHRHWKAFVVNTDVKPFPQMETIVQQYDPHGRQIRAVISQKITAWTEDSHGAFVVADEILQQHCLGGEFRWMLITNGDNWYAPDALDYLPKDVDLVLLNFYSRHVLPEDSMSSVGRACCVRLNDAGCMEAAPRIAEVDLGGMIINAPRFEHDGLAFAAFTGHCKFKGGCHDGAMAEAMIAAGWSYTSHAPDTCALYHNENPQSCALVGGIWVDLWGDPRKGCYYMDQAPNLLPVSLKSMKYAAFLESEAACVCE